MPEKISQSLEGVSETLLMTLYVRARESQRPKAMIKDDMPVAMVNQIDYDFSRLRIRLCRYAHHGYAGGRLSHYGARLERTGAERHDADILAEQFGTRDRTRARGKRQRPVDCL